MQGAGILALMWDFVSEVYFIPAFLIGGYAVLVLINAAKRGSDV